MLGYRGPLISVLDSGSLLACAIQETFNTITFKDLLKDALQVPKLGRLFKQRGQDWVYLQNARRPLRRRLEYSLLCPEQASKLVLS